MAKGVSRKRNYSTRCSSIFYLRVRCQHPWRHRSVPVLCEEDYYYTIALATGQRLALADLFKDGADYVTPISKNIKKQMRAQMKADENVMYWTDVYGLS